MPYSVSVRSSARRALRKLERDWRSRVAEAISALRSEPRPDGCTKLKGQSSARYRVRVGDYRIIYRVDDSEAIVDVLVIGHRRDVYRR